MSKFLLNTPVYNHSHSRSLKERIELGCLEVSVAEKILPCQLSQFGKICLIFSWGPETVLIEMYNSAVTKKD